MSDLHVGVFAPLQSGTTVCLENVQGLNYLDINSSTKKAVVNRRSSNATQQWLVEGGPTLWTFKNVATNTYLTSPSGGNGADFIVSDRPFQFKVRAGFRPHSYVLESSAHPNIMLCNSYGRTTDSNRVWTWAYANGWHQMMSWIPKVTDGKPPPPTAPAAPSPSADTGALQKREADLAEREQQLKERESRCLQTEDDVRQRQAALIQAEQDVKSRDAEASRAADDLKQREADLAKREKELESRRSQTDAHGDRNPPPSSSSSEEISELQAQVASLTEQLEAAKTQAPQPSTNLPPTADAQQPTSASSTSGGGGEQPSKPERAAASSSSSSKEKDVEARLEQLRAANAQLTDALGQTKADLAITKAFSSTPPSSTSAPPEAFEAQIRALSKELAGVKAEAAGLRAGMAVEPAARPDWDGPNAVNVPKAAQAKRDGGGKQKAQGDSSGGGAESREADGEDDRQQQKRWKDEQSRRLEEMRELVQAIRLTQLACLSDRGGDNAGGTLGGGGKRHVDESEVRGGSGGGGGSGGQGAYVHGGNGNASHVGRMPGGPVGGREFTFLKRL